MPLMLSFSRGYPFSLLPTQDRVSAPCYFPGLQAPCEQSSGCSHCRWWYEQKEKVLCSLAAFPLCQMDISALCEWGHRGRTSQPSCKHCWGSCRSKQYAEALKGRQRKCSSCCFAAGWELMAEKAERLEKPACGLHHVQVQQSWEGGLGKTSAGYNTYFTSPSGLSPITNWVCCFLGTWVSGMQDLGDSSTMHGTAEPSLVEG